MADDVHLPNGMAVTADDRTLIVAESYAVGDGTLYAVTAIYPGEGGAAGRLVAVPL